MTSGGIEAFGGGGNICTINEKEKYTATRFEYAANGQAVTSVIGEWWCWDEDNPGIPPSYYTMTYAREFRYNGSRQRYLDREYDPAQFPSFVTLNDTWSDYDGDNIYGDYTVSGGDATSTNNFQPGIGRVTGGALEYTHSDMIGTLRTTSDSAGTYSANRVYTSFGEEITNNTDRYGYVGDWGYQSHDEFNYQHIGARYYDPSSGRFLQRDSIGIRGGRNVYEYVRNGPTVGVDPEGEFILIIIVSGIAVGVKAATGYYNYRAAQDAAYAARPYNDGSNESTQRHLKSRKDALRRSAKHIQGVMSCVPGTSLTGPPTPANNAASGAVGAAGGFAGGS